MTRDPREIARPLRSPKPASRTDDADHTGEPDDLFANGPILQWAGRTFRPGRDAHTEPASELRVCERYGDAKHRLIRGDVLDFTRRLTTEGLAGKVDLVYVDPPFLSQTDYVLEARLDGTADGRVKKRLAYEDRWAKKDGGAGAYLDMLAPRIDALTRLLSPSGTIWVHLDWRAAYLVRALLDEIMGRDAFKNEIVWRRAPNLGRQAKSGQFGRVLDTIVVYGNPKSVIVPPLRLEPIDASSMRKDEQGRYFTSAPRGDYTDESIEKLDKIGRIHRTASGKVYIKYFLVQDAEGTWCRERPVDTLWTDIAPLRHVATSERTGYPTQKPRALLERIIVSATKPNAIIVDAFSGSGTTAEAAHATGRRAIVADRERGAIFTARARFIRGGMGFSIESLLPPDREDEAGPATIETQLLLNGTIDVTLTDPKEPLAWATGKIASDGAFEANFSTARTPGKKAESADASANVGAEATLARVFTDETQILSAKIEALSTSATRKGEK